MVRPRKTTDYWSALQLYRSFSTRAEAIAEIANFDIGDLRVRFLKQIFVDEAFENITLGKKRTPAKTAQSEGTHIADFCSLWGCGPSSARSLHSWAWPHGSAARKKNRNRRRKKTMRKRKRRAPRDAHARCNTMCVRSYNTLIFSLVWFIIYNNAGELRGSQTRPIKI